MMFVCAVTTGKVLTSESWESVIWASMSSMPAVLAIKWIKVNQEKCS